MPDRAAFLRGVNLGPHHRVSSTELRELFEVTGFEEVATFRSSGNVVYAGGGEPPAKQKARIERELAASLGYDVATFLRTGAEVGEIAGATPFAKDEISASKGKLQVILLAKAPSAAARKKVLALATGQDALAFGKKELYWLPSGGTLESSLDRKAIAKLLGADTTRTKGTMEQLAAKHFAT